MNARGAQHLITLPPGFKKEKGQNFGWVIWAGRGEQFSLCDGKPHSKRKFCTPARRSAAELWADGTLGGDWPVVTYLDTHGSPPWSASIVQNTKIFPRLESLHQVVNFSLRNRFPYFKFALGACGLRCLCSLAVRTAFSKALFASDQPSRCAQPVNHASCSPGTLLLLI